MPIICKPCFAFDALAAISLREANLYGFRNDIPYVKDQIEKHFKGIKIPGSDSYFKLLTEHSSFDEIEKMDLTVFTKIYPYCIKGHEFEEQFLKGLQILIDMDFTHLWEEYCLPFLQKQCDEYNSVLKAENKMVSDVLSDIQHVKQKEQIENINIYMTYFTQSVSFALSTNSYITNHRANDEINIKSVLRMFAHELTHGFANQKIIEVYEKMRDENKFLLKARSAMYDKGQTGGEEEFVCALSNYICFRNGLATKDAIHNKGDGSMPIALIITDELLKLGKLPEDANAWIYKLFVNGIINADEIPNKLKSIFPDYFSDFME